MDTLTLIVIGGLAVLAIRGVLAFVYSARCPKCSSKHTRMDEAGVVTCRACGAVFDAPGREQLSRR